MCQSGHVCKCKCRLWSPADWLIYLSGVMEQFLSFSISHLPFCPLSICSKIFCRLLLWQVICHSAARERAHLMDRSLNVLCKSHCFNLLVLRSHTAHITKPRTAYRIMQSCSLQQLACRNPFMRRIFILCQALNFILTNILHKDIHRLPKSHRTCSSLITYVLLDLLFVCARLYQILILFKWTVWKKCIFWWTLLGHTS